MLPSERGKPPVESLVMSCLVMSEEIIQHERFLGVEPATEAEDGLYREQKFTVYGLRYDLSHLMGEVLTVIDASITNQVQQKAVKDIVKSRFRSTIENLKAQAKDINFGLASEKEA